MTVVAHMTVLIGDIEKDRWCEIYRANPVLRENMTLLQFLADPERCIRHFIFNHYQPGGGDRFLDLLPRQQDVLRQQIEDEARESLADDMEDDLIADIDCRLADGAYVQPLHHHRYDVSTDRDLRKVRR